MMQLTKANLRPSLSLLILNSVQYYRPDGQKLRRHLDHSCHRNELLALKIRLYTVMFLLVKTFQPDYIHRKGTEFVFKALEVGLIKISTHKEYMGPYK